MARVVIPKKVDEFIKLVNLIIDKETSLATEGNLSASDLQMLASLRDTAQTANIQQAALRKQAEEQVIARDNALGINNVYAPGSAMYLVTQLRDLLLAKNKTNAKALGAWGFTVDDSPKKKASAKPNTAGG